MPLTEDAWHYFLEQADPEELAWCVGLASMALDEPTFRQVQRALFENAELRRYAIALGANEQEAGEMVALAASLGFRISPNPT